MGNFIRSLLGDNSPGQCSPIFFLLVTASLSVPLCRIYSQGFQKQLFWASLMEVGVKSNCRCRFKFELFREKLRVRQIVANYMTPYQGWNLCKSVS